MNGKQIVALVIGTLATGCVHNPPPGSLQARLNSLMMEKETPPEKITSACCYAPPKRFDLAETKFTCPSCGRTTIYPARKATDGTQSTEAERDYEQREAIANLPLNLKTAQKLLADMQPAASSFGLKLEADALDLCPSCCHSSANAKPSLYLTVIREDGSRHQSPCTIGEIQLLQDFLTTTTWKQRDMAHRTLRDYAKTIQQLLDISQS